MKPSVFVLWALAGGAAVASAQDDVAGALAGARLLVTQGQPAAAVERLQALGPSSDPRVGQLLGVAYYHAGQPAKAIEHLSAVIEKLPDGSPDRQEAIQVLGLSHYLAGRVADAIPWLEKTRAFAPDKADLAYLLGMAYIQTRQPEKAREIWAASFAVPKASAAAHLLTARMMIRAELDELAEAELKQALAKDARLPQAHFLLGQTALFRGRLDESVGLLKRELELNPADSMALYRLGDAYLRQLKWDEAVTALLQSIWLNPYFSGPYILLGRAYTRRGDLPAAEGMLRRAIQYDPNNKAAHYLLGQLLQRMGRGEEARQELETAERLQGTIER